MHTRKSRSRLWATGLTGLLAGGMILTGVSPALADGANGEIRGYLWPGGNDIPNWEGTYRMPDGQEAWCASIWSPEPIFADSYGEPVPLTKNDGSPLTAGEMQTLAYVVSASSEAVLYQVGKTADDHAAAASVIIHDMTNSDPAVYDPEWPLTAFDDNEDPLGTGQVTTGVRGVYNQLLADAGLYAGAWQIVWDAAPGGITIGDTVQLAGTLQTVGGTPIPNRELRLTGTGLQLSASTTTTDANGRFVVDATVDAGSANVTAAITSPATTVMMREPVSWTSAERPQNMIVVDDDQLESVITLEAAEPLVPTIGTSVRDQADGDRIIPADGGTVIDTVSYENLTPGAEYTLTGELYDQQTGESTGLTATVTFTPEEANGTIELAFDIPVGFAGSTLVVFEYLSNADGEIVAEHTDIEDEAQTFVVEEYVPRIGTSARDQSDGDRTLTSDGGTVIDTVTYSGLTPGQEYTLEGVLVDKRTGQATDITGTVTFTPETSSGTVEVRFNVPKGHGGKTFVVFEYLYDMDGELVAEHTDIDDEAQTIIVLAPKPPIANTGTDAVNSMGFIGAAGLLLLAGATALLMVRRRS